MIRLIITSILCTLALSTYAIDYVFQAGRGIIAVWGMTDMIGVFAESSTQTGFAVNGVNSSDSHYASFNGYGISLLNNKKYFALSPFSNDYYRYDNISTALPVAFPTLTQTANDNISHIASCDLQAASVTTTSENTATFNFSHLCSVVRMDVKVPEDAVFTNVTLSSSKGTFLQTGTLNLETRNITPSATSSVLELALSNINVTRGNKLSVYMIFLPTDMTGGSVTATFSTSTGKDYDCTFSGRNFLAGKVYNIGRTIMPSSASARQRVSEIPESNEKGRRVAPRKAAGVVTYPTGVTTDFALALNDENYAPLPPLIGDADGNGVVNNNDIAATANHIMGNTPVNFSRTAADANNDGELNVGDLTKMSNIINKK